jgi:hypothetical protein
VISPTTRQIGQTGSYTTFPLIKFVLLLSVIPVALFAVLALI